MKQMYLFGLLDTPRYHFMMAIIALVVLGMVLLAWSHLHRALKREQALIAALASEVSDLGQLLRGGRDRDLGIELSIERPRTLWRGLVSE